MSDASNYFSLKVELDYTYSLGALKPYFDALADARALASSCPACGKVNFPPRIVCGDDWSETDWIELNGTGEVVEFTAGRGTNGNSVAFALIQMKGADNLCLGRCEEQDVKVGNLVQIHTLDLPQSHPAQQVIFKTVPSNHDNLKK
ncbi:MAG: zinc ribbon domain-containing protein [Acidiferrobacterales bacterium]|nr:zinc ribbon domain-containing protein [Acidiferrobacterales bacterium]